MDPLAGKKVHFVPLARQDRTIRRLLREGRYRNVTQFMRCAIDHYLDRLGHPTLTEQARQMAEDFETERGRVDPSKLQDAARRTAERW
jgi:Arc/MetJ-type ribon-helix-helix transcriptional regulator